MFQFFICRDHSNFVNCVRFSPDGTKFITVSSDKKGIIFDGKSGEKIGELSSEDAHKGSIYAVSWSPDGTQVSMWGLLCLTVEFHCRCYMHLYHQNRLKHSENMNKSFYYCCMRFGFLSKVAVKHRKEQICTEFNRVLSSWYPLNVFEFFFFFMF